MSLSVLQLILGWSLRSLGAHRRKSLMTGGLMASCAALLVAGTAVVDSVESAMRRTITSSVAGDLHLVPAGRARLELFGGAEHATEQAEQIPVFGEVRSPLEALDEVEAVIPMGIGAAALAVPSDMDRLLERLGTALDESDAERVGALSQEVRAQARLIEAHLSRAPPGSPDLAAKRSVARRVASMELWETLDDDPSAVRMYLDTRFSPLAGEGRDYGVRFLGTDLERYAGAFRSFRIVAGTGVPPGERGVLLHKADYDRFMTLPCPRELKALREGLAQGRRIDDDRGLQARVARLQEVCSKLHYRLSAEDMRELTEALAPRFGALKLPALLRRFFEVDDATFAERDALYQELLAPRVGEHVVAPGEQLVLRSTSTDGYPTAKSLTFYGTFSFQGLEQAELSRLPVFTDLLTFRELYGRRASAEREVGEMQREAALEVVSRDDAEALLFGGGEEEGAALEERAALPFDELDYMAAPSSPDAAAPTTASIDDGFAMHAAIVLTEGASVPAARLSVTEALRDGGHALRLVEWQESAGLFGEVVLVFRLILWVAVFMIFLIVAVIINNAMLIAWLERVGEIGTLRAIGASRGFIWLSLLCEAAVLALAAGTVGALGGAGLVGLLHHLGIPAGSGVFVFAFGGPTLHPTVQALHVVVGAASILLISLLSALYPAWVATRTSPRIAMQAVD